MVSLNTGISTILSEGLTDVLARIDADFAASGCDEKEVNNPYGADVLFNANQFISMYCASKDTDVESISQSDLEAILRQHVNQLYSFTYKDETEQSKLTPALIPVLKRLRRQQSLSESIQSPTTVSGISQTMSLR